MRYMLDTDTCIYVINERPAAVLEVFRQHEPQGLGVSSITVAELRFGAANSGSERNQHALTQFLAALQVAPFDNAAAEVFGPMKTWLRQQGTPIGPYDNLIAAHAFALGATLVTNNTKEFLRVPGLRVVNWLAH